MSEHANHFATRVPAHPKFDTTIWYYVSDGPLIVCSSGVLGLDGAVSVLVQDVEKITKIHSYK